MLLEHSIIHPPSPQSPPSKTPALSRRLHDPSANTVTTENLPVSRKRRLSDADTSYTNKRPRGLHAVSDPLPLPSGALETPNIDDWFQINFDMPDAVVSEDLDSSTLLEVEMFNDWISLSGDATIQNCRLFMCDIC